MLFSLPCSNNEKAWHRGGAGAINDAVEREKTAFLTDTNLVGPRSELMTPYNEPHTDVNTRIRGAEANGNIHTYIRRGQGWVSGQKLRAALLQRLKPALDLSSSSVISAPATGLTLLPLF